MLQKTITKQNRVKDPYCMLALAVIQRASRDAQRGDEQAAAWFGGPVYRLYLDFISICLGVNLSYDLRPVGRVRS